MLLLYSGTISLVVSDLVSDIKLVKLMLNEDINVQVSKSIQDKINIKHVTTVYQFAKRFRLTNLSGKAFSYVERCFTMVVETTNFLELNFTL